MQILLNHVINYCWCPRTVRPASRFCCGQRMELGAVLRHDQRVEGELFLLAVDRQLESFRQQTLEHQQELSPVGVTRSRRADVESRGCHPRRAARYLINLQPVGLLDQVTQTRVLCGQSTWWCDHLHVPHTARCRG